MALSFRQILGASPSTVNISTSALLIIDAQNEYAEGKLKIHDIESSRPKIKELLEKYRAEGGAVVHITHVTPEGAPVFTQGTGLEEEFEELKPRDGEHIIKKQAPSSFTNTTLHETLKSLNVNQIVLCGYMAHVCITGTARSGMENGYDVVIVRDAVGDRDVPGAKAPELVKMVLTELADAIGTVVDSSEVRSAK
ncbi:hypothetical protein YB2330_004442 [Saitoella coloradoensis]